MPSITRILISKFKHLAKQAMDSPTNILSSYYHELLLTDTWLEGSFQTIPALIYQSRYVEIILTGLTDQLITNIEKWPRPKIQQKTYIQISISKLISSTENYILIKNYILSDNIIHSKHYREYNNARDKAIDLLFNAIRLNQ